MRKYVKKVLKSPNISVPVRTKRVLNGYMSLTYSQGNQFNYHIPELPNFQFLTKLYQNIVQQKVWEKVLKLHTGKK